MYEAIAIASGFGNSAKIIVPRSWLRKRMIAFSDGFSKALITVKENHNAEITNNQSNVMDISEQNLKNNVNNMIEKNEDPSDVPVKPSDPSDPSADLDNNHKNNAIDEKQDTEAVIKSENSPTHALEASPPSPQFECYFEGCRQRFASQSELITHMDKESAEASRQRETE